MKCWLNEAQDIPQETWDKMAEALDKIDKEAGPNNSRAARAARIDKMGLDAPRVTRDEALELCAHHIKLATMYFEAVPDMTPEVIEEFQRLIKSDVPTHVSPCEKAGMEWFKNIEMAYEFSKLSDE